MLAGEQALSFENAYGTDPADKNAGIEDGFSKTYNNKVYKDGKVIVDGIKLDYDQNEVTNPRGTLFLTMSTSAGAKYYNPIGEDQWFVVRSLDDRSQLFSNLSFSKNRFSLVTMDPSGKVVDRYTINKTDDFINNPNLNNKKSSKENLQAYINEVKNLSPVTDNDNIDLYKEALEKAELVLNSKTSSQEEIDAAINALKTRLSSVAFAVDDNKDISSKDSKNDKDDKDDKKVIAKQTKKTVVKADKTIAKASLKAPKANKVASKTSNPKTGVGALTGVYASLSLAAAGLFASKRKK